MVYPSDGYFPNEISDGLFPRCSQSILRKQKESPTVVKIDTAKHRSRLLSVDCSVTMDATPL